MTRTVKVAIASSLVLVGLGVGCGQSAATGQERARTDTAPVAAPARLAPLDDARAGSAAWCAELLEALASREVSRDELIALFGRAAGPSPRSSDGSWTVVTPHSTVFSRVEVGSLGHVRIPARVEADLARPLSFAEVERALGGLGRVPPDPHPTSRLTFSAHRTGTYAAARVFVEVERADPARIVRVEADATPLSTLEALSSSPR